MFIFQFLKILESELLGLDVKISALKFTPSDTEGKNGLI